MNRLLLACLSIAFIAGCSGKSESGSSHPLPGASLSAPDARPATVTEQPQARRTLAYEHTLQLEVPEQQVSALHATALAACRAASEDQCEVLVSRIDTGRSASAALRFRAKPAGIQKLIASLGQQAEVTSQSTQAEDLAGPIQDGEKKLAMPTAYRADLEALRKRPGIDVDALIKVTRELAQVQSELESATGKQAALTRRVETEILNGNIESGRTRSFWRPISLAATDFGGSLSQGISSAIIGVAYLLPWGLILGLGFWVVRKLWRRGRAR